MRQMSGIQNLRPDSMIMVFDTETDGLVNRKADYAHSSQPPVVQLGAALFDYEGRMVAGLDAIIKPEGFTIRPPLLQDYAHLGVTTVEEAKERKLTLNACDINGVTQERAEKEGVDGRLVAAIFNDMAARAEMVVAHNADFDVLATEAMTYRLGMDSHLPDVRICTMKSTTAMCQIPPFKYGTWKWPTLMELHRYLFNEEFEGAHDAMTDVRACGRIFFELKRRGHDYWERV